MTDITVPNGVARPSLSDLPLAGIMDLRSPDRVRAWAHRHNQSVLLADPPVAAVSAGKSCGSAFAPDGSYLAYFGTLLGDTSGPGDDRNAKAARILRRYGRKGIQALATLGGMAVIVIWDEALHEMLLVRHPGGAPTLFHRSMEDRMEWATRLDALIASDDKVDEIGATQFLRRGQLVGERTMVEAISRVRPTGYWALGPKGYRDGQVWQPDWEPREQSPSIESTVEFLDATLSDSVRNWLAQSERSPSILISGGIDSAGLAATMMRVGADQPVGYTVSFEGYQGQLDEFEEAHLVTSHLGMEHQRIEFRPSFISDHLDWMTAWYGEPFGYALHTAQLSEVAAAGHDLVFAGTGPDFWYPYHSETKWRNLTKITPRSLIRAAEVALRPVKEVPRLKGLHNALFCGSAPALEVIALNTGPRDSRQTIGLLLNRRDLVEADEVATIDYLASTIGPLAEADLMSQRAYAWTYMTKTESGIGWMQQWADAYGMRPALPFLDPRIPSYLATLANLRPDRGEFRELALKSLPRDLAYNRKLGQSLPLTQWFRGPLKDLLRERLTDRAARPDLINAEAVETVIRQHLEGSADHKWLLWKLVSLSAWHTRFKEMTSQ